MDPLQCAFASLSQTFTHVQLAAKYCSDSQGDSNDPDAYSDTNLDLRVDFPKFFNDLMTFVQTKDYYLQNRPIIPSVEGLQHFKSLDELADAAAACADNAFIAPEDDDDAEEGDDSFGHQAFDISAEWDDTREQNGAKEVSKRYRQSTAVLPSEEKGKSSSSKANKSVDILARGYHFFKLILRFC